MVMGTSTLWVCWVPYNLAADVLRPSQRLSRHIKNLSYRQHGKHHNNHPSYRKSPNTRTTNQPVIARVHQIMISTTTMPRPLSPPPRLPCPTGTPSPVRTTLSQPPRCSIASRLIWLTTRPPPPSSPPAHCALDQSTTWTRRRRSVWRRFAGSRNISAWTCTRLKSIRRSKKVCGNCYIFSFLSCVSYNAFIWLSWMVEPFISRVLMSFQFRSYSLRTCTFIP